jgi:hypothetical protein
MTGPDNFIQRWARLKRASDPAHERDTASADAKITPAQPLAEGVPDEPFDLASLPSIESIAGDTDVGAFLQSGVPADSNSKSTPSQIFSLRSAFRFRGVVWSLSELS